MTDRRLCLSGDDQADQLLANNPLALLIGMVLDQQVPMERAFGAPAVLLARIGSIDAGFIATMDPEALISAFRGPPALHRYPGSMATRVQRVCQIVRDDYGGDAGGIWDGAPDGHALLARREALPGFGVQKAKIFTALLGKQLGVTPPGWRDASEPFGAPGSTLSVADIVDEQSLLAVREHKAAVKAAAKGGTGSAMPPPTASP